MKNQNENLANKGIIVAFHIGRGGRWYNAGFKTFIGEKKIGEFTDDLFIYNNSYYIDCNGNAVGLTCEEEETGVGRINEDGEYDTTYSQYLEDCSEEEIELINNSDFYKSIELTLEMEELKK